MVNTISSITGTVQDFINQGCRVTSDWAGRGIDLVKKIPSQMGENKHVAIGIFAASNVAFFKLATVFADWLDNTIEAHPKQLTENQKLFKKGLVDGVVFGGSVAILNHLLARSTNYPLSNVVLLAITTAAIATRVILNREIAAKASADESKKDENVDETKSAENTSPAKQPDAENTSPAEQPDAENTSSAKQPEDAPASQEEISEDGKKK